MEEVARAISETSIDARYYLAGGTALALRIGHRQSVDLDYFTAHPIDTPSLKEKLQEHFGTRTRVTFEEKNTLWVSIDSVKVSFISRFDKLLDPAEKEDVFSLAGLRDITVMKLGAICGREEYKDYFDLACLSQCTDVRLWREWWEEVYPNQDSTSWLIALSAVDSLPSVPLRIFDTYNKLEVSKTILQTAKDITAHSERMLEK